MFGIKGSTVKYVVGAAAALAACKLWDSWGGSGAFRAKATAVVKNPLAFVEHYHYALVLLTVDPRSQLTRGAATVLVAQEAFSSNPFGIGKTPEEVKGNVILSSVLSGALMLRVGLEA